jgi:acetylornithine aminotransferase/acetylornithine/N-succinyldiaminopimelate aminotransferase
MHGTTFGGGPLACAVALAVIETIEEENLLQHVTEVGTYFHGRLDELAEKHAAIVDVRGMGLMLAAELDSADLAKQVAGAMLEQRILINRTSETVLRFLPPFILGKDHVDHAIDALDSILTEHAPQAAGAAATGGKYVG